MKFKAKNGKMVTIDRNQAKRVGWLDWYVNCRGYVVNGKHRMFLHRYILNYFGPLTVDHIDRNPLNNVKKNLRIAEPWVNSVNRGIDCKSVTLEAGVYIGPKGKYKAGVYIGKRSMLLGTYDTIEEAAFVRKRFMKNMHKNPKKYRVYRNWPRDKSKQKAHLKLLGIL